MELSEFCINIAGHFITFKSGGFPLVIEVRNLMSVNIPLSKIKIANHKYLLFYSP